MPETALPDPTAEARAAARDLLGRLERLRAEVALEAEEQLARWRPLLVERAADFAESAANLAAYRALRRRDLRPLQAGLAPLGLSSLGRLEGRVGPNLDAVVAALAAVAGDEPRPWPRRDEFARGEALLREATAAVFGPAREGRPVRILVTCPTEAADDPAFMEGIARAGAEAVRINCAHDGPEVWARMVASLRAAEAATGRRLKVLMDLGGPKVRTGEVRTAPDRKRLEPGDRLLLVRPGGLDAAGDDGPALRAECAEPKALDQLGEGEPVLIDDGKVRGTVERVDPAGALVRIDRAPPGGAKLKPEKGLNFPESDLDLPPLGPDDLADLDFVAANADLVGYSFVQSGGGVALLQDELRRRRPGDWHRLGIVAKVETPRAVRNLPEIVVAAAGRQPLAVMIARGDLAVEIGFVRLAEMQEEIMWLCEAARVPVVWATQVLEGLVRKGLPSRGEMTDAAMAARAECVMLNKGPYLAEAVRALDQILSRMSEHQTKKTPRLRALRAW